MSSDTSIEFQQCPLVTHEAQKPSFNFDQPDSVSNLHETHSSIPSLDLHNQLTSSHNVLRKQKSLQEEYRAGSLTTADGTEFRSSIQDLNQPETHNRFSKNSLGEYQQHSTDLPVIQEKPAYNQSESIRLPTDPSNDQLSSVSPPIPDYQTNIETNHSRAPSQLLQSFSSNPEAPPLLNSPPPPASVAEQQQEQQLDMSLRLQSQGLLNKAFEFSLFMAFIYLLGFCAVRNQLPYFSILAYIGSVCVIQILRNLLKRPAHTTRKMNGYLKALDWFSLGVLVFVALFRIAIYPGLMLIPFVIPGYITTFLSWRFADPNILYMKKNTLIVLKILFWTQVLLVLLKIDGIIPSWTFVFLVLFYFFVFLMSLSVGFFLLAVAYTCQSFNMGERVNHMIVGLIWDFLNTIFSWIWGFAVLTINTELEEHDCPLLATCLLAGFIHVILLGIYTKVFHRFLIEHIETTLWPRDNEEEQQGGRRKFTFETVKENIVYLVRVSSTYFMRADNEAKGQERNMNLETKGTHHERRCSRQIDQEKYKSEGYELQPAGQMRRKTKKTPSKNKSFSIIKNYEENEKDQEKCTGLVPNSFYTQSDKIAMRKGSRMHMMKSQEKEEEFGEKQCLICFMNSSNAVFMECGHGGICYDCALEIWQKGDTCLFCRQPIDAILKVAILPEINVAKVIEGTRKSLVLEK